MNDSCEVCGNTPVHAWGWDFSLLCSKHYGEAEARRAAVESEFHTRFNTPGAFTGGLHEQWDHPTKEPNEENFQVPSSGTVTESEPK